MDSERDRSPGDGPLPGRILDLEVLFQDDDIVVINKPAGLHVHQPEMARRRVPREMTVLWTLRRQLEKFLYPIHRLDVGTEGVLVMAFSGEVAGRYQRELQEGKTTKTYRAVCRGWTVDAGRIEIPLERDSTNTLVDAATEFRRLGKVEKPYAVGKRYQTARYSLVEAIPLTGRWHQIRRHLARTAHPIIGDREHGDSHHSRYFREELGLPGLWLRAESLSVMGRTFVAPESKRWKRMLDVLEFHP
ncbi:MAG: tRNA pseudouridine(65) synthase TruC [Bdellovibrionaceae bacterium]|nr:tRNA pseudouridine(65) synthase TruC [Pseudobdellovibrionaceae bacterium]